MKTLTIYLLGKVLINLSNSNTVHYEVTSNLISNITTIILYLQGTYQKTIDELKKEKLSLMKEVKEQEALLQEIRNQQIKVQE